MEEASSNSDSKSLIEERTLTIENVKYKYIIQFINLKIKIKFLIDPLSPCTWENEYNFEEVKKLSPVFLLSENEENAYEIFQTCLETVVSIKFHNEMMKLIISLRQFNKNSQFEIQLKQNEINMDTFLQGYEKIKMLEYQDKEKNVSVNPVLKKQLFPLKAISKTVIQNGFLFLFLIVLLTLLYLSIKVFYGELKKQEVRSQAQIDQLQGLFSLFSSDMKEQYRKQEDIISNNKEQINQMKIQVNKLLSSGFQQKLQYVNTEEETEKEINQLKKLLETFEQNLVQQNQKQEDFMIEKKEEYNQLKNQIKNLQESDKENDQEIKTIKAFVNELDSQQRLLVDQKSSLIISKKEIPFIRNSINPAFQTLDFKLLYRATLDGFNFDKLQQIFSENDNLILLIKTHNNKRFGLAKFTTIKKIENEWDPTELWSFRTYERSIKTIVLFSFDTQRRYYYLEKDIYINKNDEIFQVGKYGDIGLINNSHLHKRSYNNYYDKDKKGESRGEQDGYLAGEKYFSTIELEIYQYQISKGTFEFY